MFVAPFGVGGSVEWAWTLQALVLPRYQRTHDTSAQMGASQTIVGARFKPDGTRVFYLRSDTLYWYDLSTPWDLSTASYVGAWGVGFAGGGSTSDFDISQDGTKLLVVKNNSNSAAVFTMSTTWDPSTNSAATVNSTFGQFLGVKWNDDGTKVYATTQGSVAYEYPLSTPYDVTSQGAATHTTTATWDGRGLDMRADGTEIYIADYSAQTVYQYRLTTPWDLSTMDETALSSFDFTTTSPAINSPAALAVAGDGKSFVLGTSSSSAAFQFITGQTITTPS
jgi:Tol biopolymer transport system component